MSSPRPRLSKNLVLPSDEEDFSLSNTPLTFSNPNSIYKSPTQGLLVTRLQSTPHWHQNLFYQTLRGNLRCATSASAGRSKIAAHLPMRKISASRKCLTHD